MRDRTEFYVVQPFQRECWGFEPGLPRRRDTEEEARSCAAYIAQVFDCVTITATEVLGTGEYGEQRVLATYGDVPEG